MATNKIIEELKYTLEQLELDPKDTEVRDHLNKVILNLVAQLTTAATKGDLVAIRGLLNLGEFQNKANDVLAVNNTLRHYGLDEKDTNKRPVYAERTNKLPIIEGGFIGVIISLNQKGFESLTESKSKIDLLEELRLSTNDFLKGILNSRKESVTKAPGFRIDGDMVNNVNFKKNYLNDILDNPEQFAREFTPSNFKIFIEGLIASLEAILVEYNKTIDVAIAQRAIVEMNDEKNKIYSGARVEIIKARTRGDNKTVGDSNPLTAEESEIVTKKIDADMAGKYGQVDEKLKGLSLNLCADIAGKNLNGEEAHYMIKWPDGGVIPNIDAIRTGGKTFGSGYVSFPKRDANNTLQYPIINTPEKLLNCYRGTEIIKCSLRRGKWAEINEWIAEGFVTEKYVNNIAQKDGFKDWRADEKKAKTSAVKPK